MGHAEANWQVHHLFHKTDLTAGARTIVIRNFGRVMALFAPDEVIYPHQHARLRDEKGRLLDLNAKYILKIYKDGVRLVDHPDAEIDQTNEIIATYVPLGYLAEEEFVGIIE